jgi:glycosyltransferase involved in cell wall biosynthesis/SAM-dependent methyltransferase
MPPLPQLTSLGVNVVGYLRGGLGLGQAARLYVEALSAAGVPVRTTTVDVPLREIAGPDGRSAQIKTTDFADLNVDGELPFNLVCVNAPELPRLHEQLGEDFFADRYTIGVWAWEVDAVPRSWDPAFALVDEIWVYSHYVQEILSRASPVPVVRVPLPIVAPRPVGDPGALDLPESVASGSFTFLFLFDFYSTLQRKNPAGLIEAFTRAFEPGEGPQLVLKSHNGDFKPDRFAALQALTADRPDIHLVDRYLKTEDMAALMRRADCYVSLHRAEGFGLTLGETMALGKPVIATGFSANLDFMTPENSYLVRHDEVDVGPDGENYPATGTWAEPDLDHAAQLMREVWERPDDARARGARAQREIGESFSLEAVGEVARLRLRRLAAFRRHTAAANGALGDWRAEIEGLPADTFLHRSEMKLTFDPMDDAAQEGGAKGRLRRAALQAMRPYTYHQDELNALMTKALRELYDQFEDLAIDMERLRIGWRKLIGAVGDEDVSLLLDGLVVRPGATHPAITELDEDGQRVLRFSGASSDRATYRGFEDIFRGTEELINARQRGYADAFQGVAWVLDLGCGRGEFLDVLAERGVEARGVDRDESMVTRAREKGRDVVLGDAVSHLRGLDDRSVPGIFAAQVVEHLSADELTELLELVEAKLAPGGLAILETVNPHNPGAMKAFWTDTTHHHPLFPEVLLALCRLAGFESGEVRFPDHSADFETNLFANRDYAVYARSATSPR